MHFVVGHGDALAQFFFVLSPLNSVKLFFWKKIFFFFRKNLEKFRKFCLKLKCHYFFFLYFILFWWKKKRKIRVKNFYISLLLKPTFFFRIRFVKFFFFEICIRIWGYLTHSIKEKMNFCKFVKKWQWRRRKELERKKKPTELMLIFSVLYPIIADESVRMP